MTEKQKEILLEILKKSLDERLIKLEKKENEAEKSLQLIKSNFDNFTNNINKIIKLREEKILKEKLEKEKMSVSKKKEELKKKIKKDVGLKTGKSFTNNNLIIDNSNNNKVEGRKTHFPRMKSSILTGPIEKKNIKSVHKRLKTEVNNLSRKLINNGPERKSVGPERKSVGPERKNVNIKKDAISKGPSRGTSRNKDKKPSSMHERSKSMANLTRKATIKNKPESVVDNKLNKIKAMNQKIGNIKIILPPNIISCNKLGIIEKVIFPYLKKEDQIKFYILNKTFAKNMKILLNPLKDKLAHYRMITGDDKESIDDKIKNLENKYTKEELNENFTPFEISINTIRNIGFLKTTIFMAKNKDSLLEEIVIIYRIFCQLIKKEDLIKISDMKIFWANFSKYIITSKGDDLGKFILDQTKFFDFDNQNIFKIKEMIYGEKKEKFKKGYFTKICGTTSFFSTLIIDALEYSGVFEVEEKTKPNRIMANYIYQKNLIDSLKKYISFIEKL